MNFAENRLIFPNFLQKSKEYIIFMRFFFTNNERK